MKNVFDVFISRLDTAEERINQPEDISIETDRRELQKKNFLREIGNTEVNTRNFKQCSMYNWKYKRK